MFKFLIRNYFLIWAEINFLCSYSKSDRQGQLEVAKGIRKAGGVINYLKVDEEFIKTTTKRYNADTRITGVKLFGYLLEARNKKN